MDCSMTKSFILPILASLLCLFIASDVFARTWTNSKGKTIEARLVDVNVKENKALLKKEKGGRIINADISKLSEQDQEYLKKYIAAKRRHDRKKRAEQKMFWLIVLAVGNIPIYLLIGTIFFNGWADFFECIRFWLTPNIISMFRGEYGEDIMSEWKLGFFVLTCGGAVFVEYLALFKYVL